MNGKLKLAHLSVLTVLIGAAMPVSLASGADAVNVVEDHAATEQLNSVIANCNKSEDDRFQAQQAQFQQERQKNQEVVTQFRAQNEAMHKQYDDLRASYAVLESQNDQARKQNEDLQQKYLEMQQKLQAMQVRYDGILKDAVAKQK